MKMYVQNPENHDNQGIIIADDLPDDDTEFDGILEDGEIITSLAQAQAWAKEKNIVEITEIVFI